MRTLFSLLVFLFAHPLLASEALQGFEGEAQGTTYTIRYTGPERPKLPQDVDAFLNSFDLKFSNYRSDSEISRINARVTDEWIPISKEMHQLLAASLDLSQRSKGAFDVTIGQILKVWGFGPYKRKTQRVPGEAEITKALALSGYKLLELRAEPPALRKKRPELEIDLSGIAQGHAVDELAAELDKKGLSSYSVEIGGEVRTHGLKMGGKPWAVAVEWPLMNEGTVARVVRLEERSLSTSGSYRKFFEQNGKRYAHILDPRLGRPVQTPILSATVLTKLCRDADALAKAYMILEAGERAALARELGQPVLMMRANQTGGFDIETLQGFDALFLPY